MAGRSLNESDKESIANKFLDLMAEKNPEMATYIGNNRKKLLDDLIFVLDTKFQDLTTKSLSDKEGLSQLTQAFSLALILDKPDPTTKKTLRDELRGIMEKFGLMENGKLKPENVAKLSLEQKEELKLALQAWSEKMLNSLQNEGLAPKFGDELTKKLALRLTEILTGKMQLFTPESDREANKALINLFGMDPHNPGSVAFPVLVQGPNGLGFVDQNPNNGMSLVDRQNDPYDSQYTGGDYYGINAKTEENFRSQAETMADSFLGVLLADNYAEKSYDSPSPTNTSFKPSGEK